MKMSRIGALLAVAMLAAVTAGATEHSLGLGLDYTLDDICPGGSWVGYCKDSSWGFTVSYEAAWQLRPTVNLGCGLEYLAPRNHGWSGDRSYLALFAASRWKPAGPQTKFFLLARLGWALHEYEYMVELNDYEGSPMYSAGLGYLLGKHWSSELVYTKIDENRSRSRGVPNLYEDTLLSLRIRYIF